MHHNLKVFTARFDPILHGLMTGENRRNDRKYQVGDTVTLREGEQDKDIFRATGRLVNARISAVDTFGCQEGYVNLSYGDLGLLIVEDKNDG